MLTFLIITSIILVLITAVSSFNKSVKLPNGDYIEDRRQYPEISNMVKGYYTLVVLAFVAYLHWTAFIYGSVFMIIFLTCEAIKTTLHNWVEHMARPS